MNQIGFEKEYFLKNKKGELIINPEQYGYEVDRLGVLVEVRGDPKRNCQEALASFLSKEIIAIGNAEVHNFTLESIPSIKLKEKEILEVTTRYAEALSDKEKESTSKVTKDFKITEITAGLHIHFSKEEEKEYEVVANYYTFIINTFNGEIKEQSHKEIVEDQVVVNNFIDIPRIIKLLDETFKTEIKKSGRIPGAYEIKDYGFEYRSLPNNVNMNKVVSVCQKIMRFL